MSIPSHTSSVLPSTAADKSQTMDQMSAADMAEYDAYLDSLDEQAMVWGEATAAWN